LGCEFSVALGDLVAVAEKFGHERRGNLRDEIANRGVTTAEQVNAEVPEPFHDRSWIDVLAWVRTREKPWCAGAAAGSAEVGAIVQVMSEQTGEWLWNWDRFSPKGNAHFFRVTTIPVVFSAAILTSGWA
jgi:hypothetical protein